MPTDLHTPHTACTVEQHGLGSGAAEAGLWLWDMWEAECISHGHRHSLATLSGAGKQEEA